MRKNLTSNLQSLVFSTTAALSGTLLSLERRASLMATVRQLIFKLPQTSVAPTNEAAYRARKAHREHNASWLVVLTDSVLWAECEWPVQRACEDKMKISCPLSHLYSWSKSQIKCTYCVFDTNCEVATRREFCSASLSSSTQGFDISLQGTLDLNMLSAK